MAREARQHSEMSTELIARIETLSKSNQRLLTAAPLATSEKVDSSNLEMSQIQRIQKLSEMLADEVGYIFNE